MTDERDLPRLVQQLEVTVTRLATIMESHAAVLTTVVTRREYDSLVRDMKRVETDADVEIARVAKAVDALAQLRRDDLKQRADDKLEDQRFRRQILGAVLAGLILLLASTGVSVGLALLTGGGS